MSKPADLMVMIEELVQREYGTQGLEYLRSRITPENHVAVQTKPTEAMIEAIRQKHWEIRGCQLCAEDYREIYATFIKTASAVKGKL